MNTMNRIKARTHAWRSEGSATAQVVDEVLEFVAAIEAAMREPVAEVINGGGCWELQVLGSIDNYIDHGMKLYALPPDAAGEIAVLRDRLHGREVLIDKQQAEIERSHAAIRKANAQAEHFEREWYLRGDEIERLEKRLDIRQDEDGSIHDEIDRLRYEVTLRVQERDLHRAEIERLRSDLETAERALDAQTDFRAEIKRLKEEIKEANTKRFVQLEEDRDEIERLKVDQAKYHDLLYAVSKVTPGESCHETALRYIRQREEDVVLAGKETNHE